MDAVDRIQHKTTLEDEIELDFNVHNEEVDDGISEGLSNEEVTFDARTRANH